VRYTHFLLREVLPQHDELCFEEGRLMIQHAAGDASAAAKIALLQGQTAALYARCWATRCGRVGGRNYERETGQGRKHSFPLLPGAIQPVDHIHIREVLK
jgi:hypothetical protein